MTAETSPQAPANDAGSQDVPAAAQDLYTNRELSWLSFNRRVLAESENERYPLLERLRFLSISAKNLEEFYTVRVAGLRELAHAGNTTPAADGLTPAEQLVLINEDARKLMQSQQRVLTQLEPAMEDAGINVVTRKELTKEDKKFLADAFLHRVFPGLRTRGIWKQSHPTEQNAI